MKSLIKIAIIFILAMLVGAWITSCTKSIHVRECDRHNFGIIHFLNTTDNVHYGAYCEVTDLAEEEECNAEAIVIKPHMRGQVWLRIQPGVYQVVIRRLKNSKFVLQAWEVTVERCKTTSFKIAENKVSSGGKPYHHLAVKAKETERNSVSSRGLEL